MPETMTATPETKAPAPETKPETKETPKAPPEQKAAAPAEATTTEKKTPPETSPAKQQPSEKSDEGKAEQAPAAASKDGLNVDAPFLQFEHEGKQVQITPRQAVQAFQLVTQADQKIKQAEAYVQQVEARHQELRGLIGKQPFGAILKVMAEDNFNGDEEKAYAQLVELIGQAWESHHKFEQLSPEAKEAYRLKRENARLLAERQKWEEDRKKESSLGAEANYIQKFKDELVPALKEAGLGESTEITKAVADHMLIQKRAGRPVTVQEAVRFVKANRETQEEGLIKALDIDRLKKARPDLLEAIQKSEKEAALEAAKKVREEYASKGAASSSPGESRKGRVIPASRLFT